jgi:hypothetical protein
MLQLAVKAWAETIAVVMEDSNASDASEHLSMQFRINSSTAVMQEDPLDNKWKDCSKESMLKSLQEKSRTPEWYHAAAEKLAISAKAVCVAQHHSHWKVRMTLATSCCFLLSRCCRFGFCFQYYLTVQEKFTKHHSKVMRTLASYVGGPTFKSQPRDLLS